jgi:Asp-tRNA(Asn)/Glu-tRNA(Gln) amidotransferase A subunit family amidase
VNALADGELESAARMAAALRAGDVTAAELVERAARRAVAWQPSINAFSQLWGEEAMEEARRIGPDERPLAGVPLAVKDLFDVAGRETTGCSAAYRDRVAPRDGPVIERLRRAGLVMIGKTNQHELAAGGTNLVSACGPTANPWDAGRITGGSSGGSAAAVAAGIVPWALGSDTGGSIRIPGSLCGTFGLKPTTGALPTEGMLPLAPSMDCPGPMAATCADLRMLYEAMAGATPGIRVEAGPPQAAEGPRLGVPGGYFERNAHEETLEVVDATVRAFVELGARISRVDGEGIDDARRVWGQICFAEFAEAHPSADRRLLDPSVAAWMTEGEGLTPEQRAGAETRRQEIAAWFRDRLEGRDALLVPTTAYPSFRMGDTEVDLGAGRTVEVTRIGPGWMTCPVNLAGLPAVTLPAGRSRAGLPIGVTLIGAEGGEGNLLRLAAQWEMASGYSPAMPPIPA